MSFIFKMIVVGLSVLMVAFLIQNYANSMYSKIAFTAPIVGTMSYAACVLAVIGVVLFAKIEIK